MYAERNANAKCVRLIVRSSPQLRPSPSPSSPYSAPANTPESTDCASSVQLGKLIASARDHLHAGGCEFRRIDDLPLAVLHLLDAHQVVTVVRRPVEAQRPLDGFDAV